MSDREWPDEIVERMEGPLWSLLGLRPPPVRETVIRQLDAISDDVVLKSELREERHSVVADSSPILDYPWGDQRRFVTDWEKVPNADT